MKKCARKQIPRGPKPSITLDVVKRVADRIGRGLTLRLALAAECNAKINEETWKKALQAHPEFSPHYEAGKGRFLDMATKRLIESDELANLRWLIARRYPDEFGDKPLFNVGPTIVGIDDDVLAQLQRVARENAAGKS